MRTRIRTTARNVFMAAVVLASCSVAPAQLQILPVPENVRVADQPGSPIRLALEGVRDSGNGRKVLSFSSRNISPKPIWGMVTRGLKGTLGTSGFFGIVVPPGQSRTGNSDLPNGTAEWVVSIDFVLFQDGSSWGPDTLGESEVVKGAFEGQRRLISDVQRLMEQKDVAALREFLTRQPYLPELTAVEHKTKQQQGFVRGYGAGISKLRLDLAGRGDVKGIPARIAEMERDVGLVRTDRDDLRRITREYWFNEPIKTVKFSRGGKEIGLDEGFAGGPDWINGLSVTLKNNSEKTIKYISLGLHFPETLATGNIMLFPVSYGPHPIGVVGAHEQIPIPPDQTFTITIDEKKFAELKRFLEERHTLDSISRVNIRIEMIHFDDGTGWSGSGYVKQDPENPRRWMPVN